LPATPRAVRRRAEPSALTRQKSVPAGDDREALGTVAWTVVANHAHAASAVTTRAASSAAGSAARAAAYHHALASGFDRAFLVGAYIALLMLVIAVAAIRGRRADLAAS
jgi:hypothetical protein